jgi:hypothetical protein
MKLVFDAMAIRELSITDIFIFFLFSLVLSFSKAVTKFIPDINNLFSKEDLYVNI